MLSCANGSKTVICANACSIGSCWVRSEMIGTGLLFCLVICRRSLYLPATKTALFISGTRTVVNAREPTAPRLVITMKLSCILSDFFRGTRSADLGRRTCVNIVMARSNGFDPARLGSNLYDFSSQIMGNMSSHRICILGSSSFTHILTIIKPDDGWFHPPIIARNKKPSKRKSNTRKALPWPAWGCESELVSCEKLAL